MLKHSNIKLYLNTDFSEYKDWRENYKKLVFTGSIDEYYSHCFGSLPYRTVNFKEIRGKEILGNAVMNFTDNNYKYTRIHEHKWFTPEKNFQSSIAFEEYSAATDSKVNPYYPVRDSESDRLFNKYLEIKEDKDDVIFIGRLAEFRYYDMHQVK